jgi:hypothetical protein
MTRLLLDENVIIIQPALVRCLGSMIDAAILQQLHYWLGRSTNSHSGEKWCYKTIDEWSEEIGVTPKQAKTAIHRLEFDGIVLSCQPEGSNRRKWYRIDYAHDVFGGAEEGRSSGPVGPMERPHGADGTAQEGRSYVTEITTEITTKSTTEIVERDEIRTHGLAHLLADLIASNGSKRPNVTKAWITTMDRMVRLDGHSEDEIEAAIRWSQADDFWSGNILSPDKLRKHYDRMRLQAGRSKSRPLAGVTDYLSTMSGQVIR